MVADLGRLADVTEKEWSAQVVELASNLGWSRYHTYRSARSTPGWPDEALLRERLILLELKTEAGSLSSPQRDWLTRLAQAGVEVYVVRPRHLEHLAEILAARCHAGALPAGYRGERLRVSRHALQQVLREELDRG